MTTANHHRHKTIKTKENKDNKGGKKQKKTTTTERKNESIKGTSRLCACYVYIRYLPYLDIFIYFALTRPFDKKTKGKGVKLKSSEDTLRK